MTKIVINRQYGGFALSDAAYEKLIEWGVPVRKYQDETRDEVTGLFTPEPANEGLVIFDCSLDDSPEDSMRRYGGRYWDAYFRLHGRTHHMLVRVIEELGRLASGRLSRLEIVEIPDGVDFEIDEHDGRESVTERFNSPPREMRDAIGHMLPWALIGLQEQHPAIQVARSLGCTTQCAAKPDAMKLFEAADELLAACKNAAAWIDTSHPHGDEAWKRLIKAIDKAEGKS